MKFNREFAFKNDFDCHLIVIRVHDIFLKVR